MASPGTASLRRCETSLRKSSPRLFFSSRCLAIAQYCLTMHSLCSSLLRKSLPTHLCSIHCHRSDLLPWLLRIHIMHCLCVSALRASLRFTTALPVSTLLSLRRAMRRVASAFLRLTMRVCYSARWRVLVCVSACCSARRFYALPSPFETNHYLAYAFPLFSLG